MISAAACFLLALINIIVAEDKQGTVLGKKILMFAAGFCFMAGVSIIAQL